MYLNFVLLGGLLLGLLRIHPLALFMSIGFQTALPWLGLSRSHSLNFAGSMNLSGFFSQFDLLYGVLQILGLILLHPTKSIDAISIDSVGPHSRSLKVLNFVEYWPRVVVLPCCHLRWPLDKIVVVLVHNKNY